MKKFRAALPALALAAAFAALLRFPQEVSAAVTEGLRLSVSVLIPSLVPFFICVNLTSALGLTGVLARVFAPVMRRMFHVSGAGCTAVLCGAAGGYPSGAQCVAALYREGQLSRAEAEYLLLFCNNAGPAFLFGAVGTVLGIGMKGCLLLWGIHLLSALVIGLVNRPKEAPNASTRPTGERLRRGGGGRAERRAGNPADHNVRRGVFRAGAAFDAGIGAHSAGRGLYGADRDAGAVGRGRCAGGYADRAAMEAGARVIFSGLRRTLRLDADTGCAGPGGIIWMRNAVGKAGAGVAGCADYVFPCSAAAGDGHGECRNAARCVRGGAAGLRWDLPRLAKNEGGNSGGDTL